MAPQKFKYGRRDVKGKRNKYSKAMKRIYEEIRKAQTSIKLKDKMVLEKVGLHPGSQVYLHKWTQAHIPRRSILFYMLQGNEYRGGVCGGPISQRAGLGAGLNLLNGLPQTQPVERSVARLAVTFLGLLDVIGNTMIIVSVLTTRRLRTVTNCFVMSLAVADWLVGIFVMPPQVADLMMGGKWVLDWILCDIWISLDVLLCTASILSLCAISVDRYLAITQPLNYSRKIRSKRLAMFMILAVWMVAAAITCPPILGWYDKDRHINSTSCTYNQNVGYVVFSAMGSFFIPLIVMLYVYARISCVIAHRHNQLTALDSISQVTHHHPPPLYRRPPESLSLDLVMPPLGGATNRVTSFKRESKTAQTLSVVVGGFVACWLPFFVVYLIKPFLPQDSINSMFQTFLTWLGQSILHNHYNKSIMGLETIDKIC
uniref:G-protein coupled receptors family 1 profile domain-containing protein n=1 Tax=Timema genevievae TaxID=629358 RepID=A0A7R9JXQ9_TIMGE|nr:unnamed protein product [Timema genevievae]